MLDNVQVVVRGAASPGELAERGITEGTLLGLYEGIPLTDRGLGYTLVMPDRITIFREPILAVCAQTGQSPREVVRVVVLHEIAHHFGIPEDRLEELGY